MIDKYSTVYEQRSPPKRKFTHDDKENKATNNHQPVLLTLGPSTESVEELPILDLKDHHQPGLKNLQNSNSISTENLQSEQMKEASSQRSSRNEQGEELPSFLLNSGYPEEKYGVSDFQNLIENMEEASPEQMKQPTMS